MKILSILTDAASGNWIHLPLSFLLFQAVHAHSRKCAGQKGGKLASTIERYTHHGDPLVKALVARIVKKVSFSIEAV